MPEVRLTARAEHGRDWPLLVARFGPGWRAVSSGVVGGGLGACAWFVNTQVSMEYFEPDPVDHARRIAAGLGLAGEGVVLLTAADVTRRTAAADGGVEVTATVGLGLPVPAAAPEAEIAVEAVPAPGTINVLVTVPVPLSDAALVNAVVTATEAKTQALAEHGVPGTGTSSDAVCIACPVAGAAPEPYGGPRSEWGARIARAVHAAVGAGTADWLAAHPDGDPHRRWRRPASAG